MRWAAVKSPDRALEKVFRVYNLDASRLLDCCRQVGVSSPNYSDSISILIIFYSSHHIL